MSRCGFEDEKSVPSSIHEQSLSDLCVCQYCCLHHNMSFDALFSVCLSFDFSSAILHQANMEGRDDHVWYMSYGSNLCDERFETYIFGGQIKGNSHVHPGCRDKSAVRDRRLLRFDYQMAFTSYSSWWKGLIYVFIVIRL